MIKIELNNQVRQCEHCGARNIKRSYCIYNSENQLYIGRICLERETNINTSGNAHNAIKRLQKYLNTLDQEQIDDLWALKL